jgi:hypothetical protein
MHGMASLCRPVHPGLGPDEGGRDAGGEKHGAAAVQFRKAARPYGHMDG